MQKEVTPRRGDAIMHRTDFGMEIKTGSRQDLIMWVARGKKRGEFAPRGVSAIVRVPGTELWAVKVRRIKDAPPRWQRPLLVVSAALSGAAFALSLLALAGSILLGSIRDLFGIVPDMDIPVVIVLGLISSILMAALRRQMVEVIVRVWK